MPVRFKSLEYGAVAACIHEGDVLDVLHQRGQTRSLQIVDHDVDVPQRGSQQ